MCKIPNRIPVIVSPHPVFFPQTHVSLHVLRNFYDYLNKTAPTGGPLLGMVLQEAGDAVLPIGCVGRVIHVCFAPCGRIAHVALHGLKRFRILELSLPDGHGEARIEVIEDRPGDLAIERKRILLDTLERIQSDLRSSSKHADDLDQDDETFLNFLCLRADLSPTEKYFLLEAEGLDQRCGRLIDLLRLKGEGQHVPQLDHD